MLGRDHALLGAAAYLGAAPAIVSAAHMAPYSPVQLAVGAATCAGFALLPDIDEPGSTVSRKLGPISEAIAVVTKRLAGGHRQGTHSLLFVGLTFLGVHYALHSKIALGIIVFCALALSLRMILPLGIGRSGLIPLALIAGATWYVIHSNDVGAWFPYACAAGVFLHLVGDFLTVEGVPFFWFPFVRPMKKIRLSIPLLGHTASMRESIVGFLLGLAIILLAFVHIIQPEIKTIPTQIHHINVHAAIVSAVKKTI